MPLENPTSHKLPTLNQNSSVQEVASTRYLDPDKRKAPQISNEVITDEQVSSLNILPSSFDHEKIDELLAQDLSTIGGVVNYLKIIDPNFTKDSFYSNLPDLTRSVNDAAMKGFFGNIDLGDNLLRSLFIAANTSVNGYSGGCFIIRAENSYIIVILKSKSRKVWKFTYFKGAADTTLINRCSPRGRRDTASIFDNGDFQLAWTDNDSTFGENGRLALEKLSQSPN